DYTARIADAKTEKEKEDLRAERDARVASILADAALSGTFILVSVAGGAHSLVSVAAAKGGRTWTVREEVATIGKRADPDELAAALKEAESPGSKHMYTTEEKAYLQDALASARDKTTPGTKTETTTSTKKTEEVVTPPKTPPKAPKTETPKVHGPGQLSG